MEMIIMILIITYFSANMSVSKNYIFLLVNTTLSYNKCNVASSVTLEALLTCLPKPDMCDLYTYYTQNIGESI